MSDNTPIALNLTRLQITQVLEAITIAGKAPHVPMEGMMALALLYSSVKSQADAPAPAPAPAPAQKELELVP